nr:flagellar basal body P-ring formation chaperone FlgA [Motiliproteus sp. SC1-56]
MLAWLTHIPLATALPGPLLEQAREYVQSSLAVALQPGDRVEIQFAPSHSRLQLSPCGEPLRFESTRALDPGRFSLKVDCRYPKHWSLRLNGEIEVFAPVLVSRHALPRGTRLGAGNTQVREEAISRLRAGFFRAGQPTEGYETLRAVRQGQVLTPRDLAPPLAVLQGDKVTITAGSDSLEIRTEGIALEDGRRQQQIRVRNSGSGKVIRARVVSSGLVRAGP